MKEIVLHLIERKLAYARLAEMLCAAAILGSFLTLSVLEGRAQHIRHISDISDAAFHQATVNEKLSSKQDLLGLRLDAIDKRQDAQAATLVELQTHTAALDSDASTMKGIGLGASGILLLFQLMSYVFQKRDASRSTPISH